MPRNATDMKCFAHPESDAAGTCQHCGRGLCPACSQRFTLPLCESCLLKHNRSVAARMALGLTSTVVLFVAVTYLLGRMSDGHGHTLGYGKSWLPGLLLAFTYWGWRFLSERAPRLTMGSGVVWLVYFMIKFIAAYLIGIIVGPYQIVRMARQLYITRKTRREIAGGLI